MEAPGIVKEGLAAEHIALLHELLRLHTELNQGIQAVLAQPALEAATDVMDMGSRTTLISWPDLGVLLACHGYKVHHTELQAYFMERFQHQ